MKRKRIGITLIIVGLAGAAILALLGGMSESRAISAYGRANVGCRTWFQFDRPGTYYIFVETGEMRVIDQGCPPSATSEDLVLSLYADSRPVALVPDASLGYTHDGSSAVSTSRFELETSGRFELVAVGPNVEQVVALGADPGVARRPWWFAAGMALSIGLLGGLVVLLTARNRRSSDQRAPEVSTPKPSSRPGLPANISDVSRAKAPARKTRSDRPTETAEIETITAVTAVTAVTDTEALAQLAVAPPAGADANTPTGQGRPLTAPVVSSGSTSTPGRRRSRGGRNVDAMFDSIQPETVGDALDAEDVGGRQRRSRRGGTPRSAGRYGDLAPDNDLARTGGLVGDELDADDPDVVFVEFDDIYDDDYDIDGIDDIDDIDAFDDGGRDDRPRGRERGVRPRRGSGPPGRRSRREGYVDDEFLGDEYLDDAYLEDEYVDDVLDLDDDDDFIRGADHDYSETSSGRRSRARASEPSNGYVEDYLDDLDAPPRRRPPRAARTTARQRSRQRQAPAASERTRRQAASDRARPHREDTDRDGFAVGRQLPEQRRTQPRRRRTPPPPPPPGDDWEELPPPTQTGQNESDGPVVSDEWTSDGDDTGAWRWWSPPDPGDRTPR